MASDSKATVVEAAAQPCELRSTGIDMCRVLAVAPPAGWPRSDLESAEWSLATKPLLVK